MLLHTGNLPDALSGVERAGLQTNRIKTIIQPKPRGIAMSKPIRLCALLLACFLFFSACTGKNTEITVFYTTDTHGHLTPNHPGDTVNTIDLAQIASLKKGTPNALLLDSGDFLHGTILANLSKGADIILLMKQSGYDAAAIGNHEFSHGSKALKERSA
jgi:5''-nucleotidase/2'',3''-cyclic phosphodiesterase and related esterases